MPGYQGCCNLRRLLRRSRSCTLDHGRRVEYGNVDMAWCFSRWSSREVTVRFHAGVLVLEHSSPSRSMDDQRIIRAGWFAVRKGGSPEQQNLGLDALLSSDGGGMNINTFKHAGRQS